MVRDFSGDASSEAQSSSKYGKVGLNSYCVARTCFYSRHIMDVHVASRRSPVMDATFSFCLDSNKDEYDLRQRYIYKPHPPPLTAATGRMVRQLSSTSLSPSLSLSLTHTHTHTLSLCLSISLALSSFSPLFFSPLLPLIHRSASDRTGFNHGTIPEHGRACLQNKSGRGSLVEGGRSLKQTWTGHLDGFSSVARDCRVLP